MVSESEPEPTEIKQKFTPGTKSLDQLAALWKDYTGELELYFLASGQDAIYGKQKV